MVRRSPSSYVIVNWPRAAIWSWLMMSMLVSCSTVQESLPAELLGTWTTEDPSYEDRFIQIFRDRIYFGTGQDEPDPNAIVAVSTEYRDDLAICTIDYREPDGDEYRLLLRYQFSEDELRLANRARVIWTRVAT